MTSSAGRVALHHGYSYSYSALLLATGIGMAFTIAILILLLMTFDIGFLTSALAASGVVMVRVTLSQPPWPVRCLCLRRRAACSRVVVPLAIGQTR
jgi:hypothetical protein